VRVSLFAELKRRNVLRVAALYGAVAWLLLQVGDVVVEPLELPAWTMKLLILLLAGGFVVAIAVAWQFELTPQGLQRDSGALDRTIFASAVRRGINAAIVVILLLGIGYYAWTRLAGDREEAAATGDTKAPVAATAHTLAVLPFASLSSDADDGYFADGLSEELLNLLAGIEGLKVAGRTSSFYFKGRNEDLRAIGRQLGVANILEGSVRRSGTRVRVTAQLINAEDGFHLWSETYDRELSDVLAMQDEIGRRVADALKIELMGDADPARDNPRPAVDPEAYRLYLVARSKVRERGFENLQSALKLFRAAAQRDPTFSAAHAGEAIALGLLWNNHGDGDPADPFALAERAARKAIGLDPQSSDANAALGRTLMLRATFEGAAPGDARRYLEQAVTLDPGNAVALYWLARFEVREDNAERALELFDKVLEVDPLEFIAGSARAELLSSLGRGEQALAEMERLAQVYPDNPTLMRNYSDLALTWGQLDRALELLEQSREVAGDMWTNLAECAIRRSWGDEAGARGALGKIGGSALTDWTREGLLAAIDRDYETTYRLDRTFVAGPAGQGSTGQGALAYSATLTGHWDVAEGLIRRRYPQVFADAPTVTADWVCSAGSMALVREKLGDPAGARRVAEAALATWDRSPMFRNPADFVCRAQLLVVAGRKADALASFEQAVDAGYRLLVHDDAFSLRDDPVLRQLNGEPRYEAQWQRIEADLARQRAAYEARKKKAAGA
jgi:TolB-like protein/Flp pilus assembly protein TadD